LDALKQLTKHLPMLTMMSDQNLDRFFAIFKATEPDNPKIRLAVSETLLQMSTLITARKQFLVRSRFKQLCRLSLTISESLEDETALQIAQNSLKMLLNAASLSESRVYIPGETHIAAQLRRRAFELGLYCLVVHVYHSINEVAKTQEFKQILDSRFLNLLEMSDLETILQIVTGVHSRKSTCESEDEGTKPQNNWQTMRDMFSSEPAFPSCLLKVVNISQNIEDLSALVNYLQTK
jgi:hypothetical protein